MTTHEYCYKPNCLRGFFFKKNRHGFLISKLNLFQEIRREACKQGEILIWLKSRLASLTEISSESETRKQGDGLSELSNTFKRLLTSLAEV